MNSYKEAKIKLIQKYSKNSKRLSRVNKNLDSFITINDFLDNELSLGPRANPGRISYHFQNYENINNYINILIKDLGFNKVICLSDFSVKFSKNTIIRNSIVYSVDHEELIIPYDLINEIQKCKNNSRFIYINLILSWENRNLGHANMMLIDIENKTIERYEPYGKTILYDNKKIIVKGIDSKFNKNILSYLGLDNYKYLSPVKFSPVIGVQKKADVFTGMCVTYCVMYLQLRMMNPDVAQVEIIKYMKKKPKNEIISIILRYARYIENNIKNKSYEIIFELNNLYSNTFYEQKDFILITKDGYLKTLTY